MKVQSATCQSQYSYYYLGWFAPDNEASDLITGLCILYDNAWDLIKKRETAANDDDNVLVIILAELNMCTHASAHVLQLRTLNCDCHCADAITKTCRKQLITGEIVFYMRRGCILVQVLACCYSVVLSDLC